MCKSYLTYKELAVHLKLAEKTVKQNWRYYPHVFVTPCSGRSQNLKGARFELDVVMDFLKEATIRSYNDDREKYEEGQPPNSTQMAREPVRQGGQHKTRGKNTEDIAKRKYRKESEYASEYSVF